MIPTALRVVALMHLVFGLLSVAGILVQLTRGQINLDFGVLGIPIYFGLMRFSNGWRTCALVFTWFGMIMAPIIFILGIALRMPAYFQIFGIPLGSVSPIWISVAVVPGFLLSLWQYSVLTRDDIRSLFHNPVTTTATGAWKGAG